MASPGTGRGIVPQGEQEPGLVPDCGPPLGVSGYFENEYPRPTVTRDRVFTKESPARLSTCC